MLRQQKNNLEKFKYNSDVRNFHIKLVLSSTSQLIFFLSHSLCFLRLRFYCLQLHLLSGFHKVHGINFKVLICIFSSWGF